MNFDKYQFFMKNNLQLNNPKKINFPNLTIFNHTLKFH
jgi:hypothetical protein